MDFLNFFKNKKVFVTGHTGFMGAWLVKVLCMLGADVTGYALKPDKTPNLFTQENIADDINSIIGDVCDFDKLNAELQSTKPDVVIHLAAQAIVSDGYKNPRGTYETNVMGTANILEAIRNCDSVRNFLNVTTDKVYQNNEWVWGYRENDILNGYDPYSNSKSCSELITATYKRSFFKDSAVKIVTARPGNVIGGGDYSADRILPDCVRAVSTNKPVIVRNPNSIRPYQHVLEPIFAYLMLIAQGAEGSYNIGPNDSDCVTTGELAEMFCRNWGSGAEWKTVPEMKFPHEANFLRLDTSKLRRQFNWKPKWDLPEAVERTVVWYKNDENIERQIERFLK